MTPMIGSIIVFLLTYVVIASEKVDKTAAALLGASIAIGLHLVPYHVALESVDLNVVLLLVGMMMVVTTLASTGLFEWVAVSLARKSKGDGLRILVQFCLATALLSAFLDNVTTVILVAPITILICELLELPAAPILVLEAIASNIGGTATLIGDPPNILIASQTGLTFNEFIYNLSPVVVVMVILGTIIWAAVLRKRVQVPEALKARVLQAKPERAILHPGRLKKALVVFAFIMLGFFVGHPLGVEPGVVAIGGAIVMALVCGMDMHKLLEKVEWNSVFFFIGLFMLIGALEHNGAIAALSTVILDATGGDFEATVLAVLWFAGIASAIVDNIPLVIAMLPLLKELVPVFAVSMGIADDPAVIREQVEEPLYWALALGACLGGNGTIIGASANVVITQIAKKNGHPVSFAQFSAWGAPTMIGTLIISTAYVYLRYLS